MPLTAASPAASFRLRARWVVPVDAAPIERGEVVVEDGRIVSVGRADHRDTAVAADVRDFGAAALLPGFVNVHCHLEYTVFRGLLEEMAFFPWIRALTALKAHLTEDDWVASATLGAAEMLRAGVTTVGECADAGASLEALLAAGLRGVVFREVFGIGSPEPADAIVAELAGRVAAMRARVRESGAEDRVRVGISPHAPYTVPAPLFPALAAYANRAGLRQAIHVAESPAEVALISAGAGPFAEMFARRNIPWQPANVSPARYVADAGGFDAPTLAVHCVHTDADDAARFARRGVSVAHCPKSNGKLGAGVAPLRTLLDAGLAVGLGTDSVASNNAVDLFEEMRAAVYGARAREQDTGALTANEALHLATLGGATALGLDGEIGSLAPGKRADLCVVRLDGLHHAPAEDDPVAALVYSARASDVALTMAGGRVLYDAGAFPALDVPALRARAGAARAHLREAMRAA